MSAGCFLSGGQGLRPPPPQPQPARGRSLRGPLALPWLRPGCVGPAAAAPAMLGGGAGVGSRHRGRVVVAAFVLAPTNSRKVRSDRNNRVCENNSTTLVDRANFVHQRPPAWPALISARNLHQQVLRDILNAISLYRFNSKRCAPLAIYLMSSYVLWSTPAWFKYSESDGPI